MKRGQERSEEPRLKIKGVFGSVAEEQRSDCAARTTECRPLMDRLATISTQSTGALLSLSRLQQSCHRTLSQQRMFKASASSSRVSSPSSSNSSSLERDTTSEIAT